MFDLQVLAYQTDMTRVATFMIGARGQRPHLPRDRRARPAPPAVAPPEQPEKLEKLTKINTFHVELFAYFLERLRGDAGWRRNAARSSCSLYGAASATATSTSHDNLPVFSPAAARAAQGRPSRALSEGHAAHQPVPHTARPDGRPAERVGDSTGEID